MQVVDRSGAAPFALSVLAGGNTGTGVSAQESLQSTISLARMADRRAFARFWMSEHHAMPAISIASPAVMISRLIGETTNIRLGAGGVMLPNHAPLVVAEEFGMLAAMAPGRIDLGLGRAPGTDGGTAQARRRGAGANAAVPQQVLELLAFLNDDFPSTHPFRDVHAVPGPWQAAQNGAETPPAPEVWTLGSSPYSAQLAAQLGRPYAFALQFGDADIDTALRIYREQFQPSATLSEPYALASVPVAIAEDPAEARRQSRSAAMAMLRMFKRESFLLLAPDAVEEYQPTAQERQILDAYTDRTLHGTAATVARDLEALHARTDVDELMLVPGGHSSPLIERGLELLADHYDMPRLA